MYPRKERIISLLEDALNEMDLVGKMSSGILSPDDFTRDISGLTAFRACGMSLQYITGIFVKIRNLSGRKFFNPYTSIPWDALFGMRNFLSHEYGDVDSEAVFNTVRQNIPELIPVTRQMLEDVESGKASID